MHIHNYIHYNLLHFLFICKGAMYAEKQQHIFCAACLLLLNLWTTLIQWEKRALFQTWTKNTEWRFRHSMNCEESRIVDLWEFATILQQTKMLLSDSADLQYMEEMLTICLGNPTKCHSKPFFQRCQALCRNVMEWEEKKADLLW